MIKMKTAEDKKQAVLVSRHKLLPKQAEALDELGFHVVERIEQLPTDPAALRKLVREWQEKNYAVITVALPPHLLASLSPLPLYVFKMESTVFENEAEAEKWLAEKPDARTLLPGRPGEKVRGSEFKGISKLKVIVEEEHVWPK